jgi:hypothetical protein
MMTQRVQIQVLCHRAHEAHWALVPLVRVDRVLLAQVVRVVLAVRVQVAPAVLVAQVVPAVLVAQVVQVVLVVPVVPVVLVVPVAVEVLRVQAHLLVAHHVQGQQEVVAMLRVLLAAVVAVRLESLASPSAHVVKNSTTWQHRFSVAFRCNSEMVPSYDFHAVHP